MPASPVADGGRRMADGGWTTQRAGVKMRGVASTDQRSNAYHYMTDKALLWPSERFDTTVFHFYGKLEG